MNKPVSTSARVAFMVWPSPSTGTAVMRLTAGGLCGRQNITASTLCRLTGSCQQANRRSAVALTRSSRRRVLTRVAADGSDQPLPGPHQDRASSPLHSHPIAIDQSAAPDDQSADQRYDQDFGIDVDAGIETGESAAVDGAVSISTAPAQGTVGEPPQGSGLSPQALLSRVPGGAPARLAVLGLLAFVTITGVIGVARGILKFRTPRAKKIRNRNKNKTVVDTLSHYLPHNRTAFGKGEARGLKMKSGFSGVEIFRKYLWYLLRERSFDNDAVADMVQLKQSLGLTDDEVVDALKERSERLYKAYGNVMLDTEGMTKSGIERKATCRSLFSKLLYLAESEEVLPDADAEKRRSSVVDVFGATDDDAAQLRIVSLYEVDESRVDQLASEPDLSADLDE